MPNNDEKQIVSLNLDYSGFEKGAKVTINTIDKLKDALSFKKGTDGIDNIQKAVNKVDFSAIQNGIESLNQKFSASGLVFQNVISNITNTVMNKIRQVWNEAMVVPVREGFGEYELKMGSVQTIMASTGASLEEVNGYLQELNAYADKTIYSFSDMTASIGKFTNAGVKLEDAVKAIQGISNEAAISGAGTQEASRAMYNFAQALSAGAVKLIDWKSIENANMATVEFKQKLIDSAVALGTVVKVGDKYQSTTTGLNGGISELFDSVSMFNDSLSAQWMTTEVLVKTLGEYADETTEIGKKAFAAAQDVKTWTQLLDTLKEAIGSGWATSFELIIGDYDEAKELFTKISNTLGNIIDTASDTRNAFIQMWRDSGGREKFLKGVDVVLKKIEDLYSFIEKITDWFNVTFSKKVAVAKEMEEAKKKAEKFKKVLDKHPKTMHEAIKMLKEEEEQIKTNTEATKDQISELEKQAAKDIWLTGKYGTGEERKKALEAEGLSYEHVQGYLEEYVITGKQEVEVNEEKEESIDKVAQAQKRYTDDINKYAKTMRKAGYSEVAIKLEKTAYYISGIISNLFKSVTNIGKAIGNMIGVVTDSFMQGFHFDDLFGIFYNASEWIENVTENLLEMSTKTGPLKRTLTYIFDVISRFSTIANYITRFVIKSINKIVNTVKPFINYVYNNYEHIFNFIFDSIESVYKKIKKIVIKVVSTIQSSSGKILPKMLAIIDKIKKRIQSIITAIKEIYKEYLPEINTILNKIKNTFEKITIFISNKISFIINYIKEKIPTIISKIKPVFYAVTAFFAGVITSTVIFFKKAVEFGKKIVNKAGELFIKIKEKTVEVFETVSNFIQEKLAPVIDFIKDIVDTFTGGFTLFEEECVPVFDSTSKTIAETFGIVDTTSEHAMKSISEFSDKSNRALSPVINKFREIKDAIDKWANSIGLQEKFNKIWNSTKTIFTNLAYSVKNFISDFIKGFKQANDTSVMAERLNRIKEVFMQLVNWVKEHAVDIIDTAVIIFDALAGFTDKTFKGMKEKITDFIASVKDGTSPVNDFMRFFKDDDGKFVFFDNVKKAVNNFFHGENGEGGVIDRVKLWLTSFIVAIQNFVKGIRWGKVLNMGVILVIARSIWQFMRASEAVVGGLLSFKQIFNNISTGIKDITKAFRQKLKVQFLDHMVLLILALTAALITLSYIPTDKLLNVSFVLIALLMILEKIYARSVQASQIASSNHEAPKKSNLWSMGVLIAGLGVAVFLIMQGMATLTTAMEKIQKPESLIIAVIALFSVIILMFSFVSFSTKKMVKITRSSQAKGMLGVAAMLIALGVAMFMIAMAAKKFAMLTTGSGDEWYVDMIKGVAPILAIILAMSILIAATSKAEHAVKAAIAMVILAVAITMLTPLIGILAAIPENRAKTAVGCLLAIAIGVAALIAATSLIKSDNSIVKMAVVIILLTASLYLLTNSGILKALSDIFEKIDWKTVVLLFAGIAVGIIALAGALWAFGTITATVAPALMIMGKAFMFFGVGMLAVAGAVFILLAAFELFPNAIDNIIAFANKFSENSGKVVKVIATFIGLVALGIAIGVLAVKSKIALTIIMLVTSILTILMSAMETHKDNISSFLISFLWTLVEIIQIILLPLATALVGLLALLIYDVAYAIAHNAKGLVYAIRALIEALITLLVDALFLVIQGLFSALSKIVKGIFGKNVFSDLLDEANDALQQHMDDMTDETSGAIDEFGTEVHLAWEDARDALKDGLVGVADTTKNETKKATKSAEKSLGGFGDMFKKVNGENEEKFDLSSNWMSGMSDKLAENMPSLDSSVLGLDASKTNIAIFNNDTSALAGIASDNGYDVGSEYTAGLQNGITDTADSSLMTDIAGAMGEGFESYDASALGESYGLDINNGIDYDVPILEDKAEELAEETANSFNRVAGEKGRESGKNWVMGVVKGIKNYETILYGKIRNVAEEMNKAFDEAEQIESPSKVMAKSGMYWIMGIIKGINNSSRNLYSEIIDVANNMVDNFGNPMTNIQDILDSGIDIQPRICPVVDLTGVKTGSDAINGLLAPQTELMAQVAGAQMNINQEIDTTYDDSNVIDTIDSLKDEIIELKTYISSLKVTLDSGALVGQIAGKIDDTLGQRQVYRSRRN